MSAIKQIRAAILVLALGTTLGTAHAAPSGIKITEWMYNGLSTTPASGGEFVEFTNFGPTAVNFSGWSFDDNSRVAGSESLSAFGSVASGESVIFTDLSATTFRTIWNLSASIKVIGGNLNNLGRSDEINLYDNTSTLIDRLTYNDQGTGSVASPRTSNVSGIPGSLAAIGANNASLWVLSSVGDGKGSYLSTLGEIGSPGTTPFANPVPEPETYAIMLAGLGLLGFVARRKEYRA